MSLATLQLPFAKLNNADLLAFYNGSSFQELRQLATDRCISLTHVDKKNVDNLRKRLADVDRCWVQTQKLHALDATVMDTTQLFAGGINGLIYTQFGCMPQKMAEKHLIKQNQQRCRDPLNYMEAAPGRGKPRVRFRRKLPGMVPNKQMKSLIIMQLDCARTPGATPTSTTTNGLPSDAGV